MLGMSVLCNTRLTSKYVGKSRLLHVESQAKDVGSIWHLLSHCAGQRFLACFYKAKESTVELQWLEHLWDHEN